MVDGTEDKDSGEDGRVLEEAEGRVGLSLMRLSMVAGVVFEGIIDPNGVVEVLPRVEERLRLGV
jgi:hypothetical protein